MAICKECGRIFGASESNQRDMCPECVSLENEDFELVKQYIEEHPRSNMIEIVRDTQVPMRSIQKFIDSGRLHSRR